MSPRSSAIDRSAPPRIRLYRYPFRFPPSARFGRARAGLTGLARRGRDPTILPAEGSKHVRPPDRGCHCIKEDHHAPRLYREPLSRHPCPALAQVPDVPRHELGQPRQVAGRPDVPDRDAPTGRSGRSTAAAATPISPTRPCSGAPAAWGSRSTNGRSSNCEEMRSFLGLTEDELEFRLASLDELAPTPPARAVRPGAPARRDRAYHGRPQGLAADPRRCSTEDGFVYITTPDRDWQGNADRIRVTRDEDGWHVRNGYTFEQLETVLEEARVRADRPAPVRHPGLDGRDLDPASPLPILDRPADGRCFFPLLKLIAWLLSPWRDPHTIFVLARKRRPRAEAGPGSIASASTRSGPSRTGRRGLTPRCIVDLSGCPNPYDRNCPQYVSSDIRTRGDAP